MYNSLSGVLFTPLPFTDHHLNFCDVYIDLLLEFPQQNLSEIFPGFPVKLTADMEFNIAPILIQFKDALMFGGHNLQIHTVSRGSITVDWDKINDGIVVKYMDLFLRNGIKTLVM